MLAFAELKELFAFIFESEKYLENVEDKIIEHGVETETTREPEPKDCPICLESISTEDSYITECNHTFHLNCIKRSVDSLNNKCPMCRSSIDL